MQVSNFSNKSAEAGNVPTQHKCLYPLGVNMENQNVKKRQVYESHDLTRTVQYGGNPKKPTQTPPRTVC